MSYEREKEKGKRPEPMKRSPSKSPRKKYQHLCYPDDDAINLDSVVC